MMRWVVVIIIAFFVWGSVVGAIVGPLMMRIDPAEKSVPIVVPLFFLLVGGLALGTAWLFRYMETGQTSVIPASPRLEMPEIPRLPSTRSLGIPERVLVATASSLLVYVTLRIFGVDTDLKLFAVPLGFVAVYEGLSVFG